MLTASMLWGLFVDFDIPICSYGEGKAKRLEDLFNEVNDGDCELIISKDAIYRKVSVIKAKILFQNLILKEVKQVFSDERKDRERGFLCVSEKIICGENKEKALKRAIVEELNITSDINFLIKEEEEETKESSSYPGLKTIYTFINFEVALTDEQFKKDGYVELNKSTGITTHFKWVENI